MKTYRDVAPLLGRHAGRLAAAFCVLAALGFGAALEGYSHVHHPLALLGARGVAGATAFNLMGYVVPGVLAAMAATPLRGRMPVDAGWRARIGAQLLWLSALAFAAQGLLPLDPGNLDGPTSRWHALAWTLWWIASAAGSALVAIGLLRHDGWRWFAGAAMVASVLIAVPALAPPTNWPAGIASRIALAAWLGLWLFAAHPGKEPAQGGSRP